jgi:hypothetical protein
MTPGNPRYDKQELEGEIVLFTAPADSIDTQSLMRLAGWYHAISARRGRGKPVTDGETPSHKITAVQLEWAAREIDKLRVGT